MGAANLYLDFRSLAVICILVFSLELYSRARERLAIKVPHAVIVFVGLIAVWICADIYKDLAVSGNLGVAAQEKYESQVISLTGIGLLDTLFGGRSEILVSVRAVLDAPIWGHGSWAADYKYVAMYEYIAERLGADLGQVESDLIPSHSHLFGAWVESGVVGGLFFVYVLWIVGSRTFELTKSEHPNRMLLTFVGMTMVWDVLFSPFGGEMRIKTALGIAMLLVGAGHDTTLVPQASPEFSQAREDPKTSLA
jgi:O-antigen ligase